MFVSGQTIVVPRFSPMPIEQYDSIEFLVDGEWNTEDYRVSEVNDDDLLTRMRIPDDANVNTEAPAICVHGTKKRQ